jgi:predicted peptidase
MTSGFKQKKVIAVLVVTMLSGFGFSPQQLRRLTHCEQILSPKVFQNSRGETLPYRLFIPPRYDKRKKYPLVLYLHGGGGIGNDNRKQIDGGNGYLIDLFTGDETT